MRVSALPRVVAAVVVSVAAAALLSGCAALPYLASLPLSLPGTTTSAKPVVGDCWATTYRVAAESADWTENSPVPCGQDHELLTFAVPTIASSASTWTDSSGSLTSTIANAAGGACGAAVSTALPDVTMAGRFMYFFFVPSIAQWREGARWVRCDAAILTVGTPVRSPELDPISASVAGFDSLVGSNPLKYGDCVTTTDPSGATGPADDQGAVRADCSADYQWMYHGSFDVPGAAGAPYPSDAVITQTEQSLCGAAAAAAGRSWTAYVPTTSDWTNGARNGACWFYRDASLG